MNNPLTYTPTYLSGGFVKYNVYHDEILVGHLYFRHLSNIYTEARFITKITPYCKPDKRVDEIKELYERFVEIISMPPLSQ